MTWLVIFGSVGSECNVLAFDDDNDDDNDDDYDDNSSLGKGFIFVAIAKGSKTWQEVRDKAPSVVNWKTKTEFMMHRPLGCCRSSPISRHPISIKNGHIRIKYRILLWFGTFFYYCLLFCVALTPAIARMWLHSQCASPRCQCFWFVAGLLAIIMWIVVVRRDEHNCLANKAIQTYNT